MKESQFQLRGDLEVVEKTAIMRPSWGFDRCDMMA